MRDCAEGVARYLEDAGLAERGLVIGFDTRFASENFAAASAEVVAAHGIKAYIFDSAAATPVACHAILDKHAGGAIVITASHNPGAYNGFKYKPEYAGSAPPEVVDALEAAIETGGPPAARRASPSTSGMSKGLIERFDPRPAYDAHVARLVDLDRLRAAGLNVVFDAMHATGAGVFARLLTGGTTRVNELRGERNPAFPGMVAPEPIARNLAGLMETVVNTNADIGLATDGDADRLGVVDEKGHFVDQLQTFALLCYYLLEYRGLRAPIVRSLTSTRMIDRLGEHLRRAGVRDARGLQVPRPEDDGDRAPWPPARRAAATPSRSTCRSATAATPACCSWTSWRAPARRRLQLVHGAVREGRRALLRPHRRAPAARASAGRHRPRRRRQARRDRRPQGAPQGRHMDGYRFEFEGGWLLVRPSGTEPLLRIYTETTDQALVKPVLEAGRELAGV